MPPPNLMTFLDFWDQYNRSSEVENLPPQAVLIFQLRIVALISVSTNTHTSYTHLHTHIYTHACTQKPK